jgi:HK97 family phage major capsid protein
MIELVNHKLAGYSLASNEVREDAGASIDALMSSMFGRAVGAKENYAFFRGDGVSKPKGILLSGAYSNQTRHSATTVALTDLALMMSVFIPSSWGKGAWFANPGVMDQVLQLISSPLSWMPDLRTNPGSLQLLGMPLYITGALPALGTSGDFMLVDPSYYLIGDRRQLTIAYSEHYKFLNDQGTWRFTSRVDGQPWINGSITLENASTTVSAFIGLTG